MARGLSEKLNIKFITHKTESLVKFPNVYLRHKYSFMPHGKHMFNTLSEIDTATMFAYTLSKYLLTHWKCVLPRCEKFLYIDLPNP